MCDFCIILQGQTLSDALGKKASSRLRVATVVYNLEYMMALAIDVCIEKDLLYNAVPLRLIYFAATCDTI